MVLRLRLTVVLIALLVCKMTAQTNPPQQVQVGQTVSQGLLVYKVQPSYPPLARQARVQGTVVLQALIGKDGTIQDLSVISGHPMLIQAAMDAVKQWRYKPYLLNGELVRVQTTINVNFELNGPAPEAPPNEPAANGSPSESDNSNPPATPQAGQGATSEQYPGVYRVGGAVSAPKATFAPDPQYSEEARTAHYEGTVVLWLVVDADGLPQNIKVQRALGMGLDEEAIKGVKRWRFQPAMKDGKPVPVMINVQIDFRLDGKPGEQPAIPPSTVPSAGQDANTLLANASSAYAMHDYGSAIPLAIRVTEMYPQGNAWNLLGLCYMELDELRQAEAAFQRQIDVSPQSSFAYNNLGRVYARQRKFDMAIAQFRKQIEINPRDRYAHMNLAGSLRAGKKCDQAIPEYQLAAELTPDNAGPHIGLAQCYFDQGKQDSGVAELDKAAALTSSGPGWNALAWTLAEHELHLDRAEQYARQAVSMNSSTLTTVSLDPLTPGAYGRTRSLASDWDTLGWILYLRGDFTSAEKYITMSWTLSPNPTVSDHLAQLSEKLGRKDDSLKYSAIAVAEGEVAAEAQEDSDGNAVANSRERLVRLAPSAAASNQISQDAQQWLERQGSFALPNPAKHAGSAEFALLRTHGQSSAKARWMAGDAALKDFESEVAAGMPAGPAEVGAIDVLRWGTLSCEKPDAECHFRLSSAREAVYAQLRSTVKTPASDSTGAATSSSEQYPGVYRVGGDVSAPKLTYRPDPQYSEEARHARYQGTVVLWLVVDTDGLPQKIRVQRSLGMGLDEEAVKAVKQWRFKPAEKDGKPVPVMINVEVNFKM